MIIRGIIMVKQFHDRTVLTAQKSKLQLNATENRN